MTKETTKENHKDSKYVAKDINRVELYLMFSTDGDFWVNSDGLKSFIDAHLSDDILKFDFRVDKIPLGNWDERQLIRLSVECPQAIRGKEDHIPGTRCFYHPDTWAEEAIEQVLLPAYMWIFAEIGIGNSHEVSSYFRTNVFDLVNYRAEPQMSHWLKSSFSYGVRLLPRIETMSGNYDGSWAQFRFVLGDAKDNGDPKSYIDLVIDELDREHEEQEGW